MPIGLIQHGKAVFPVHVGRSDEVFGFAFRHRISTSTRPTIRRLPIRYPRTFRPKTLSKYRWTHNSRCPLSCVGKLKEVFPDLSLDYVLEE